MYRKHRLFPTSLGLALALVTVALGCQEEEKRQPLAGGLSQGGSAQNIPGGASTLGKGSGRPWSGELCAESSAETRVDPVYLIFLLDQSGSMGDGVAVSPAFKWTPVTDALRSFFESDSSKGFFASLTLFPTEQNPPGQRSPEPPLCEPSDYEMPVVEMRALPEGAPFAQALSELPNESATPSWAALSGAINYAQQFLTAGKRAALVLVTDGQPAGCGQENTLVQLAKKAASVAETLPTYVIGVGSDLLGLNYVAEAGGTREALIVEVGDPDATRIAFLEKVQKLARGELPCEYPLPRLTPPQVLNPKKVNVELTLAGKTRGLQKEIGCNKGMGWRYNSDDSPTKILLCDTVCSEVKSASQSKLDVVFGCETSQLLR